MTPEAAINAPKVTLHETLLAGFSLITPQIAQLFDVPPGTQGSLGANSNTHPQRGHVAHRVVSTG